MVRDFRPDSLLVGQVRPSPNFRERKPGERWDYIILHGTWLADDETALGLLCDPAREVSCHYLITHGAKVVQLVGEAQVAWHAGKSAWQGREMLNGCALGIEIGNAGPWVDGPVATVENEALVTEEMWQRAEPYTAAQYEVLVGLLKDVLQRNGLGPEAVLGHDEVAPGRKSDPGRHFDWEVLVRAGVALPRPLHEPLRAGR